MLEPPRTSARAGVQGAICTGSGRFKHIEPHRTFSNYILTEIARYIEFFYTSSGWFDWTKPSLTTIFTGDTIHNQTTNYGDSNEVQLVSTACGDGWDLIAGDHPNVRNRMYHRNI